MIVLTGTSRLLPHVAGTCISTPRNDQHPTVRLSQHRLAKGWVQLWVFPFLITCKVLMV